MGRRLAVGSLAEVLEAFRADEERAAGPVILKRMLPHLASERGAARLMEEEAALASKLDHPNVVRVLQLRDDEGPCLVLERVEGTDVARLRRWLEETEGALGVEVACLVGAELLSGLHALHDLRDGGGRPPGPGHGAVTPSTVLLSREGDVKLANLGVAQALMRSRFPQAAASRSVATLGYLAPEQLRQDCTDRRVDVFAAAVIVAELLIGEPLFARGSELTTLLAIRDGLVDPLLTHAAKLPAGLCDVLLTALAVEPSERFQTAAELRDALLPHLGGPAAAARAELAAIVTRAEGEAERAAPRPRTASTDPLLPAAASTEPPEPSADSAAEQPAEQPGPRARPPVGLPPRTDLPPPSDAVQIGGGGWVQALARSATGRVDGLWVCERADIRKEVYLIDGTPEFVSSNLPSELLGEFLVARGTLSRGELDMALAVLPRFDGRLGDTLAALGLVEPVELFRHIADQVWEKLLDLFLWTEGVARFHDAVPPPLRYFPLGLDAWRVIGAGLDRRLRAGMERDRLSRHAGARLIRTRTPAPDGLPSDVEPLLVLAQAEQRVRDAIAALSDPGQRDPHRAERLLLLAEALDLVRVGVP